MKKITKRVVSAAICACMILPVTLFTACKTKVDNKLSSPPDYSSYTRAFDAYAYSGPNDGTWTIDNEVYSAGQDFRTEARLREYKDAGFSIFLAQSSIPITNATTQDTWDNSLEPIMDAAHAAGLKVILTDSRIQALSLPVGVSASGPSGTAWTIGESGRFKTEAELDEVVSGYLEMYKDHPAFYGVMLADEPSYHNAECYGAVYKSLKRVMPEIFVQYNLLPLALDDMTVKYRYPMIDGIEGNDAYTDENVLLRYKKYIELFLDATGAPYVQYDHYPMQASGIPKAFLCALQTVAEIAKERDIELRFVAQTFSMLNNGNLMYLTIKEDEARWINNVLLGFGVKQISYFTYWTKQQNYTMGETFIDGGSFITRAGEKTDLYYFMQKIMAENQKFASAILNFDYRGSKTYKCLPCNFNNAYIDWMANDYVFEKSVSFSINKEFAIVTELLDKENNRYMYMVMNAVEAKNKGSRAYQTVTAEFPAEYTHVAIYKNGERTTKKLDGGKAVVKLAAGEAAYFMPY